MISDRSEKPFLASESFSTVVSMRSVARPLFYLRGGHKHAPIAYVKFVIYTQADVTVNARPGVPAGVGQPGVIHANRKYVLFLAEFQIRRQFKLETGITIRPASDELAVDPNFGVAIYAVEFDGYGIAFAGRVEFKVFAVPGDPAGA